MSHFRNTSNFIQNFRESNTQGLEISKRVKFPQDDRTDTKFTVPLRMLFQRSKSILDRLKSVFNAFRRKPSLGAPVMTVAVEPLYNGYLGDRRKRPLQRGLNKSQCMDCAPKKSGRCREVAVSGDSTVLTNMLL